MYQMTVTFTDEEYARLMAEATKHAQPVESLAHDLIAQTLPKPTIPQASADNSSFVERLYHAGKVLNLPRRSPLTSEEIIERERLATLLAGGKSAADMVIEDRGPR